ncbi:MFS transporter [Nocardiopsis sp. N85]|uniref:MFS transporter n=1 Tax=Nocardiopsis sp. N85 TaxID=3029400 RepID=UPI00237F96DA|nr:MFS transporter [Nocardiopsis sp. N85]MDE3725224.1 MFS transporter [Nocardiopsis sp. N85]
MTSAPPDTPARTDRLGGAFHRLLAACGLANLGDGMLSTALPLIAATLTHDPLAVSGLLAARFLPWLLIAPLSGVLLDRVDRLRAMTVANAVAAVAVVLLAVTVATGRVEMWILYAVLFTVITCETVSDPAAGISVVRLVPARLLDRANGRLEGLRLVAQDCLAKPVAGLLFAAAALLPVVGAALSYALCAVLVLTVVLLLRRRPDPDGGTTADVPSDGVWRSLREGLGHVFGDRLIRRMMFANAGTMAGMQMGTAVMVLHVQQVLEVPVALYGVFMAAIAVGGIAGSAVAARLVLAIGRRAVMMGGYLGMGCSLVALGVTADARIAAAAWAVSGVAMTVSNIAGSLFFQTVVPEHLRGRVSTAFRTIGWGLAPGGALIGGLLGRIDLALPYLAGGLVMICTALLFRRTIAECARLCDEAAARLTGRFRGREDDADAAAPVGPLP